AEPAALHPAWEKALEATPEYLRGPIVEQIRRSEVEAQSAIQAARGSIEPQWQELLTAARAGGVSPQELTIAWDSAQAIRTDPQAFAESLNKRIEELVKDGTLTAREGAAAKVEAAAAAGGAELDDPLLSPEAQRLIKLEQELEDLRTGLSSERQQQQQAAQQQQEQQRQQEWGDKFFATVDTEFQYEQRIAAAATPEAKLAVHNTRIALARLADTYLEADQTGTLTEEAAIKQAVAVLQQAQQTIASAPAVLAAQQQAQQIPVGGGSSSVATVAAQKFATEDAREKAMLDEAARFAAQN
ncbi:MAG: hypothetical protein IT189_07375, partial [Microbacteriaceae bacterium]|nr:hypothetical protein [Microbacteriaceae bacterium]